jgi:hypothetical protein
MNSGVQEPTFGTVRTWIHTTETRNWILLFPSVAFKTKIVKIVCFSLTKVNLDQFCSFGKK